MSPNLYSARLSVIGAFAEVARTNPGAPAITSGGETWTYSQLCREARKFAGALSAAGPTVRRVVALVDQAPESIAAMLGIAWAGKTWVLADCRLPHQRLMELITHAQPDAIVFDERARPVAEVLARSGVPVIEQSSVEGASEPTPCEIAYILYTSGSTGTPKGVIQSHANLAWHIEAYSTALRISANDRLTLLPLVGVDAALMDIFGALCNGASLHIFDLRNLSIDALPKWIAQQAITIYHSTPTIFRALGSSLAAGELLSSVRHVVLGGELAYASDHYIFRGHFSESAVLVNGLGPSESTIALQCHFRHSSEVKAGPLPVGNPVGASEAFLIDENHRPTGARGQLVIRGPAVAVGYWQDASSTASHFIDDPVRQGWRSFCTGDICERLADGRFVAIGRRDGPIKIRGVRIDTEEIESAIHAAGRFKHVGVTVVSNNGRPDVLTALLVTTDGSLDIKQIRNDLAERLPQAMIPGWFEVVPALPLTPSSKIDRRRLKDYVPPNYLAAEIDGKPLDSVESWLAAKWRETLGSNPVSRDSDFFAIGGDSLSLVRLLTGISTVFGVSLSPRDAFTHSTLGGMAQLLKERMTVGSPVAGRSPDRVPTDDAGDGCPASLLQEQLWLSELLSSEKSLYHVAHCLELSGKLNIEDLEKALQALVRRHDALHTAILRRDGAPWLSPMAQVSVRLKRVDLSHMGGLARSRARELAEAYRAEPMQVEKGEVLRAAIVKLSEETHLLILVVHHLAADGQSVRLIFKHWAEMYNRLRRNDSLPLATNDALYSSFARRHRAWRQSTEYAAQRDWWNSYLAGMEPLALPYRASARAERAHRSRVHRFRLAPEDWAVVASGIRNRGITLYMAATAALAVVLSRYCSQTDIGIATPVSNRNLPEAHELIGHLVNTIIVRLAVNETAVVDDFLRHVKASVVECLSRATTPFLDISTGNLRRGDAPFQVMLAIQHLGRCSFEADGVRATSEIVPETTVVADMCVTLDPDEAECVLQYTDDLFSEDGAKELSRHFQNVLVELLADKDVALSSVSMLDAGQAQKIVALGRGRTEVYDVETPLHVKIRRQAERIPRKTAIVFDRDTLSYEELFAASSAIADELMRAGVLPGDFVPVVATRGPAIVIAWLAVLLADAAFVPVDGEWPERRIREAVEQCGGTAIVRQRAAWKCEVVKCNVPRRESVPNAAYAVFTSGSSGKPKLPMIAHRSLSNRFEWMSATFAKHLPPTTLQTTPHIYDSAIWQLLWPLTLGGKVVLSARGHQVLDGGEVARIAADNGVTILDFVPSLFEQVLVGLTESLSRRKELGCVQVLILGGEQIRSDGVSAIKRLLPHVAVVNLYGPSEATIGCVWCRVSEMSPPFPIGEPIPNVEVLVLDAFGRLVPRGVTGEIYLGGECVGLGYRGSVDTTKATFIQNPFPHLLKSSVLYRTGDLGRFREDGQLECIGRADNQLKIMGVRINPSEVEAVIGEHPQVRDVAVDLISADQGVSVLCAWIAPAVPDDIREYCLSVLPTSFVPTEFVGCVQLPLSPAGKVDRKALRGYRPNREPRPQRRASSGALERRIAAIWCDLLSLKNLEPGRTFFEAGGNSLLAIKLHFVLEKELGIPIALTDLFRYPTVETFAKKYAKAMS